MGIKACASAALAIGLILVAGARAAGAQSFGASTPGGSASAVVRVTNLNDSGPGSLRDAVAGGNRTVVFDVGGSIALDSEVTIRGSFVTVDGLSAPAPGITLRHAGLIVRGPDHDIIIRGLRIRDARQDGIWVTDAASRVLIEHVSVHNSGDGNVDITRDGTRDVTVAWSVLASPADTEKNMLIAFSATRVFLHHNLFIASRQRNPQVSYDDSSERRQDPETTLDMRNNLLWDWRGGLGSRIRYGARANVINNYFAAAGGAARRALIVCRGLTDDSRCSSDTTNVARAYVWGNISADGVDIDGRGTEAIPFPAPTTHADDPHKAACDILARAGVRPLDALDESHLATVRITCVTPPSPPAVEPIQSVRRERVERGPGRRRQPPSFLPTSAMPSPIPLKALPTVSTPSLAPRPAVFTASTAACAPTSSLAPAHLAAPSSPAPAFTRALVASLPDFCSCSAVACQAVASAWST